MTNWQHLESIDQFESLLKNSCKYPVLIFKNSTRCNISTIAKLRLEDQWKFPPEIDIGIYCLDVIAYRDISNKIEEKLEVPHETPKLLLIQNGHCSYHASHFKIHIEDVEDLIIQT